MIIRFLHKDSLSKFAIFVLVVCMWGFVDVPVFMLAAQMLFFAAIGIEIVYNMRGRIKNGTYLTWALLWVSFCCGSVLWSKQKEPALTMCIAVIQVVVISFLLLTKVKKWELVNFLFNSFIIAGIILAARLLIVTPVSDWGKDRFGMAIATHVNTTSMNLLISELFAVYMLMKAQTKKRRLFYILSILFFCVVIIASASKKTAIFMVLGPFLMYMSTKKLDAKIVTKGIGIILAGCVLVGYLISTFPALFEELLSRMEGFVNLLTGSGVVDKSTSDRQYLMSTAFKVFLNHPVLGVGIANYRFENRLMLYAHSNPLEILANLGIVGFAIYYSLYVMILRNLNVSSKTSKDARLLRMIFLCLCMLELICVVYESETVQLVLAVLWIASVCLKKDASMQIKQ